MSTSASSSGASEGEKTISKEALDRIDKAFSKHGVSKAHKQFASDLRDRIANIDSRSQIQVTGRLYEYDCSSAAKRNKLINGILC